MRGIVLALVLSVAAACAGGPPERKTDFKVVVLGFDGVDPDLVRRWLPELPHMARLSEQGTLTELATTNPPESPVAWASFATGLNPGKHGIFDFLKRDPQTYIPDIGLVEMEKPDFLFGFFPLSETRLTNNRQGVPYWKHLDQHGIRSAGLRIPLELPPASLSHGKLLSGLGVPDVGGTWGTYFYLASDLSQWDLGDTEFGGRLVKLNLEEGKARAELEGPVDPRRDDFQRITVPLELELNPESTAVTIRVQNRAETVTEMSWSDWFAFEFSIGPFASVRGVSRFYVLETFPELRLYLMPISLDPAAPWLTFSSDGYSEELAERIGPFKTVGWIHETWGLNEEHISEDIFLEDLFRNMETLQATLLDELDRQEASLYTAVFTATDSVSHMFYRLIDPEHPRYDSQLASRHGNAILSVYRKMDAIIGEVLERLGEGDILMVVSDHGFHPWRKEFNTNTWLARNGYLHLKGMDGDASQTPDALFGGGSFFPNVDWSKSRAYSLGLGQIYVNLKGREGQGIVERGEPSDALVREISSRILEYRDPDTGEPVLQGAYLRDDLYWGDRVEHSGDIQLSFRSGYRTSWQTALGAVPEHIVVANLKKWSGDHCASDTSDTAGFFLSNRKVSESSPSILDIAPTLYQVFGVPIPPEVDGRPLNLNPNQ